VVVCVPLWRGDKPVGVFTVDSSRPRSFDERDVGTLTSLADFMKVVIAAAVDLAGVTDAMLSRAWHDGPGAAVAREDDWTAERRFVAKCLEPVERNPFDEPLGLSPRI
jgi:transcriptional regulator with GAF, ATPase, and Fis domain